MIIINNDSVIKTKKDLSLFLEFMEGETYDENSSKVSKVIQDYLSEFFDRMDLINMSLHEKISEDLDAFAIVDFGPTVDYSKNQIKVFSKDENKKIKESERILFNGIVDRHLKGFKPLWDRFMDLDLD